MSAGTSEEDFKIFYLNVIAAASILFCCCCCFRKCCVEEDEVVVSNDHNLAGVVVEPPALRWSRMVRDAGESALTQNNNPPSTASQPGENGVKKTNLGTQKSKGENTNIEDGAKQTAFVVPCNSPVYANLLSNIRQDLPPILESLSTSDQSNILPELPKSAPPYDDLQHDPRLKMHPLKIRTPEAEDTTKPTFQIRREFKIHSLSPYSYPLNCLEVSRSEDENNTRDTLRSASAYPGNAFPFQPRSLYTSLDNQSSTRQTMFNQDLRETALYTSNLLLQEYEANFRAYQYAQMMYDESPSTSGSYFDEVGLNKSLLVQMMDAAVSSSTSSLHVNEVGFKENQNVQTTQLTDTADSSSSSSPYVHEVGFKENQNVQNTQMADSTYSSSNFHTYVNTLNFTNTIKPPFDKVHQLTLDKSRFLFYRNCNIPPNNINSTEPDPPHQQRDDSGFCHHCHVMKSQCECSSSD